MLSFSHAKARLSTVPITAHISREMYTVGGESMSDKEKKALTKAAVNSGKLVKVADESTVLAITASYLAGKEAGKREAEENQPG